ncbi:MAG TPA: Ig domain-containing protein [Acidimicrobiales bacterium]
MRQGRDVPASTDTPEFRGTGRGAARRRRGSGTRLAVVAAVVGVLPSLVTGVAGASAAPARAEAVTGFTDPTVGHAYRHGVIPRRVTAGAGEASTGATTPGSSGRLSGRRGGSSLLSYGGGPVVSGQPKVYLVFWGSQWGTQSTSNGYQVFSGDPVGAATDLQAFFAGLGSDKELWSTIAGQYCEGTTIGATSCPLSAAHVAYPSGGVLAGVWEDTSFSPPTGPPGSPSTPGVTARQIAQEAAAASVHFGDSSANAQYIVVSPTGTNPDGWNAVRTGYCAYHNSTGAFLSGPDVAYTNLPYVTDAPGEACSAGLAASPAGSDAVTETAGHEYYETLTDGFQTIAWLDARGNEIADKCESLAPGVPGGYFELTLSTGTFPVQGMWANNADNGRGACVDSELPILVTNPGKQAMVDGTSVTVAIMAGDLFPGQTLSYSATGLPAGLSINASSGVISGVPTGKGHSVVTVTVADSSYTVHVSFTATVKK